MSNAEKTRPQSDSEKIIDLGWNYAQPLPVQLLRCVRKLNPHLPYILMYAKENKECFVCRVEVWRKILGLSLPQFQAAMRVGVELGLVIETRGKPYRFERDFDKMVAITDQLLSTEETKRSKSYPQPHENLAGQKLASISKHQVNLSKHQSLLLANSTYNDHLSPDEIEKIVNQGDIARLNIQTHHIDYHTTQLRAAGEVGNGTQNAFKRHFSEGVGERPPTQGPQSDDGQRR